LFVPLVVAWFTSAMASSTSALRSGAHAGGGFRVPDRDPAWSPDGGRVAFEREGRRESSVWLVRRDGTGAHRVSRYSTPLWTPDGRRMAILESGMIWLANGDGSRKRLLARGRSGAWSPNGLLFAFNKDSGLHVANRDGTGVRRVPIDVPTCSDCASAEYEPAWSPDGRTLAFVHSDVRPASRGVSSIWAADVDGSNLRRISESFVAESPAWSPDGSMIAYLLWDNLSDDPYLHISDSDGSRDRRFRLAYEYRFSWAPRGELLAYEAPHPLKRLYLLHPSRGTVTIRGASRPSWTPGGRAIAFERQGSIYVSDTRGRRQRPVARGANPAWSPDGAAIAYAGDRCGPHQGIHVVAPSGRLRRKVTDFCFIWGSARSELLRGTPGNDLVRARSGDDLVLVHDSRRDVVICGPGRDTVRADRLDRLAGCEVIRRGRKRSS
jgi:dipeptidyl aminopeptidase/acylaminoacyl peptidase